MAQFNKIKTNKLYMRRPSARMSDINSDVLSVTDSTVTITQKEHAGTTIVLNRAAGVTVTLPAASGSGAKYKFIVGTTVTSNSDIIQVANATDEFAGAVYQVDTDTADAVAAYPCLAADNFDTITMDGSTTGGLAGDWFEIIDIASGVFALAGWTNASGTVATPVSAAVS